MRYVKPIIGVLLLAALSACQTMTGTTTPEAVMIQKIYSTHCILTTGGGDKNKIYENDIFIHSIQDRNNGWKAADLSSPDPRGGGVRDNFYYNTSTGEFACGSNMLRNYVGKDDPISKGALHYPISPAILAMDKTPAIDRSPTISQYSKANAPTPEEPINEPTPALLTPRPAPISNNVGEAFRDCTNCPEMVVIPSGSFQMGSNSSIPDEKPVHHLNINYSFAVGKYEVTQAEWGYLMGDNPSKFIKTPSNPVENITWLDAQEYIKRLSAKTGRNYRLLTEVEWEYVARAGSTTKYSCGNAPDCLANIAWNLNSSNKQTHPVGQKDPNSFGVYDMLGNVSEWVEDCYSKNYAYDSHESGYYVMGKDLCPRVHRGGHWGKASNSLSVSKRERFAQDEADYILGFRIAVTLER